MTTPETPSLLAGGWPVARRARLANGLPVAVVPLPHLHTAAVCAFVRVGSRLEGPEQSGLSHLLEHVLFRGCEGWPSAAAFNEAVEAACVGLDAGTYRDFTAFDALCAPDRVPEVLALLGAMLRAPAFADLEVERRIILEEIADEVDEKGRDVDVDNLAKAALFPGSGLGRKIGGTPRVLKRLSEADVRAWHGAHYNAANVVVCVAGPVDPEATLAAVQAAFGALPAGERADIPAVAPREDLPALGYTHQAGSRTTLQLAWALPEARDPAWPALLMAHRLLDDGSQALLRKRVVDQDGLAYEVAADLESYQGVGVMVLEASSSHANSLPILDAMREVLDGLAAGPAPPEAWARARSRYAFELASAVDAPLAVTTWFGLETLLAPHDGLAGRYARVAAVRPEDVVAAVREHLAWNKVQVTVVGDLDPVRRATLRRRLHRRAPA